MRAPEFWYGANAAGASKILESGLKPLARVYGALVDMRMRRADQYVADCPVICVGNLVVGGAGKTPIAIAIGELLKGAGKTPAFLTRGYGGSVKGPIAVDPLNHNAHDVGDEPLLLARVASTWVGADRAATAKAACRAGCDVLVMDDGFQNTSLAKDLSLLVVDAKMGIGNGRLVPAGPLRESLQGALARTQGVIVMGDGEGANEVSAAARVRDIPVLRARLKPVKIPDALNTRPIVAFAGIAQPEKFFRTLAAHGMNLVATHAFADHHRFTAQELRRLKADARVRDALLVTTEKDAVRLPPEMRNGVITLPVAAQFDSPAAFRGLINAVITPRSIG